MADALDAGLDAVLGKPSHTSGAFVNLQRARETNPDEAAKLGALAQATGVGPATAKDQQAALEASVRNRTDSAILDTAPKMSAWLAKSFENAAVSHDSLPDMARVEGLMKQGFPLLTGTQEYMKSVTSARPGPVLRVPQGPQPTVGSYLGGLFHNHLSDWALAREGVRAYVADMVGFEDQAEVAKRNTSRLQFGKELATPSFKSGLAGSVFGGVESLLSAIPAIAAGVATRNPATTLGLMGSQSGLTAYGKYRERGATAEEALVGGAAEGTIEAATEAIPMGFLVKRLGKTGMKEFLAKFVGAELPTEQVATFLQDAVDTAVANPDKTWGDFWKERPQAAFDTAVATAVMAGGMGSVHGVLRAVAKQDAKAEAAPDQVERFNEVVKATAALLLRERAPEAYAGYMQQIAEGVDVLIPSEVVSIYLQGLPPEEAQGFIAATGIESQLAAATTGADIVIPAATYLTHIGPTPAHATFEQDLKIGPGGMSLREAEEHKADRERLLSEAAAKALGNGVTQIEDPVERVREDFYRQAVAVGVPEDQARANAALQASYYAQRAARNTTFKDAWEAYADANISMRGQGVTTEGPRGLATGGPAFDLQQSTQTPEFQKWFADSKVVDETGAPLVVYHGTNQPIENFDVTRLGASTRSESAEVGFYFTNSPEVAESYGNVAGGAIRSDVNAYEKKVEELQREAKRLERIAQRTGKNEDWQAAEEAMSAWEDFDIETMREDPSTGVNIVPVFLSIRNPKTIDFAEGGPSAGFADQIAQAKREGHDGLILKDIVDDPGGGLVSDQYVVFNPRQIKSTFNKGTFDPKNPNILKQGPRGQVSFAAQGTLIELFKSRNASTLIHEGAGHIWLENLARDAADPNATDEVRADFQQIKDWWLANVEQAAKESGLPEARLRKAVEAYGGVPGLKVQQDNVKTKVTVEATGRPGNFEIFSDGEKVGSATVIERNGVAFFDRITLDEAKQRRGIGSAAYSVISRALGKPLVPSPLGLSESATKVWKKKLAALPIEEAREMLRAARNTGREYGISDEHLNNRLGPLEPQQTFEQGGSRKSQREDVEAIRPFHEMFARAAERYVMEGKAPTEGLRSTFAKFRQWLVGIYKDFTALRVPMTDEMRGVFDRLAAGEVAIDDAITEQALEPLPPDTLTALMSPAEIEAYLRAVQLADAAAEDRLLAKLLGDVRRKHTEAWKSERAGLVEDFQAQVDATPEMQALTLLETGEVRIQRQSLTDAGVDEATLYRRQRPYVFEEGLPVDALAEQVGLDNGQELIASLVKMKEEHDALRADGDTRTVRVARAEALADQEMLARHGDILNDGTIGDEAIAALQDVRRSEVLMSEVRALVRKGGEATTLWTQEEMAAWAARQLTGRPLSLIRPHIYKAAEAKAGRDALKALVKDDFATALDAKFRQLLNMHLYRAARDAREAITKGKTLFERIAKARNGTLAKTRNMDLVSAARAVIEPYGYGAAANDTDYMRKVQAYDPELWADIAQTVETAIAQAKPVDELTLDEFTSLHETVQQLWVKSRRTRQMEVDFQLLETEDVAADLAERLVLAPPAALERNSAELMRMLSGLRASGRRVESWVTALDGSPKGPWRTYLWQPVREAVTRFELAKRTHLTAFMDALKPVEKTLTKSKIAAPEIGYTFGSDNSGYGKSALLHAILHTGNDSNKRKLLLGRGWAVERADGSVDTTQWDAFVQRMHDEGVLTQADYDFAQATWDLLERIKPDAQRAHRTVFGRYFEEITAQSFDTPFGTYRGGYMPAITDSFLVQEQELNRQAEQVFDLNTVNMFPSPNRGFTKSRVEYNAALLLDLGYLPLHIDTTLKFAHLAVPTRDALRLLGEKALKSKLGAADPTAMTDLLLPWLNRTSRQVVQTSMQGWGGKLGDRIFRALRTRTGMGIMMGNLSNTVQQLTGWFPAALRVRKRFLTRALYLHARDPFGFTNDIAAMSPFMLARLDNSLDEIRYDMDKVLLNPNPVQQAGQWVTQNAYFMQRAFQNFVDSVTWAGAFEQQMQADGDFTEAVRYADSAVRETQGSLSPVDISKLETGNSVVRVLTQFWSYFNTQANLLGTEGKNAPGAARLAYVAFIGGLMPAIAADAIKRSFGAGWDDDDDDGYLDLFLDTFLGAPFRYGVAMIPGGQVLAAAANQFNDKRYDDVIAPSPAASALGAAARVPKDLVKVATEGKGQKAAVRDTATLITLLTGNPLPMLAARPAGYAADLNEGKVDPTSGWDLTRGLLTGTASEESKVN